MSVVLISAVVAGVFIVVVAVRVIFPVNLVVSAAVLLVADGVVTALLVAVFADAAIAGIASIIAAADIAALAVCVLITLALVTVFVFFTGVASSGLCFSLVDVALAKGVVMTFVACIRLVAVVFGIVVAIIMSVICVHALSRLCGSILFSPSLFQSDVSRLCVRWDVDNPVDDPHY